MAQDAQTYKSSDEIDLRDLFLSLWASKVLILGVMLVATSTAGLYAFLTTPIYQTSVHILPPTASGLTGYNVASQLTGNSIRGAVSDTVPGIEPMSPKDAYEVFLRYLNSSTIKQEFFEKFYLPTHTQSLSDGERQRAWKKLNDQLLVTLPQRETPYEASVTLEGENPATVAQWADAYVDLAMKAASADLLDGLKGEVHIRKLSLQGQIATLKEVAKKVRQDRITRLREGLSIAQSIGLEDPADGIPLIAINTTRLSSDSVDNSNLIYLRGAKALRSELQQLEKRQAEDAYIPELPDLLKKLALLNSINLDGQLVSAATIDQAAIVPDEPIKPNRPLIILIGLIMGVLFGILTALLLRGIQKR